MMHAQDEEEPHHRAPLHPECTSSSLNGNGLPPQELSTRAPGHSSHSNGYSSSASSSRHPKKTSSSSSKRRGCCRLLSSSSSSSSSRCYPRLPNWGRRKVLSYSLPLWAFVFVHVVLDVRPSSYLPRSFLESLSWEWGLRRVVEGGSGARDGEHGERTDSAEVSLSSAGAAAVPSQGADVPSQGVDVPSQISPEIAKRVDEHPYNLLRDVADVPVNLDMDLPYFWHIHKSGGSSMKHIMYCLGRTQTRRIDEKGCSDSEPDLHVCRLDFGTVVNADASSPEGIERAIKLKLSERVFPEIEGTKAFVVDTSRVFEAMPIFSPYRKGRLFVLFRHPVERAVSKYHYIKIATWEKNYKPELKSMTMMEYAQSRHCYNNWMTRRLVHKMTPGSELTRDDLDLAKEILRRKALVLFTDDMAGAAERVRQYFFWSDEALGLNVEQKECLKTHIYLEPMNVNPHPSLDSKSPEWAAIRDRNLMDIELVSYARELYVQQGEMIRRILRGGTYRTEPPQQGVAQPGMAQPQ